jgi:hypothetical protein
MALVSDEMTAYALQLQELDTLEAEMQLRGPETTERCEDLRAALALQRDDLQRAAVCAADHARVVLGVQDHSVATNLARAFDSIALQERNDHALACRLGGVPRARPAVPPEPSAAELAPLAAVTQPERKMRDPFGLLLSSVGVKPSSSAGLAAPPDEAPPQRNKSDPFATSGLLPGAKRDSTATSSGLLSSRISTATSSGLLASRMSSSSSTISGSSTASRAAAATVPVAPAAKHEGPVQCSFCLEDTRRPTKLACGVDNSCRGCLAQLYIKALSDTSLIPVKCCQQLLERSPASIVLSADKLKRYRALEAEATAVRKMYCPKPHCSAFICLDGLNLGSSRYACTCASSLGNACL